MRATGLIKIHVQFAGSAGLRNRAVVQVPSRGTARLSFRTISSAEAGLSLSIAMPAEFSTGFSYKLQIYAVPPGCLGVPAPGRLQPDTRSVIVARGDGICYFKSSNSRDRSPRCAGMFRAWGRPVLVGEFRVTFDGTLGC